MKKYIQIIDEILNSGDNVDKWKLYNDFVNEYNRLKCKKIAILYEKSMRGSSGAYSSKQSEKEFVEFKSFLFNSRRLKQLLTNYEENKKEIKKKLHIDSYSKTNEIFRVFASKASYYENIKGFMRIWMRAMIMGAAEAKSEGEVKMGKKRFRGREIIY